MMSEPHLTGLAVPFDTPSAPIPTAGGFVRVEFLPGAFDVWLDKAPSRHRAVALLIDHDPRRMLATTADGSLRVWAGERGVYFRTAPGVRLPAGRKECSPMFSSILRARTDSLPDGSEHAVVGLAELHEISLVRQGAFSGTWVAARRFVRPTSEARTMTPHQAAEGRFLVALLTDAMGPRLAAIRSAPHVVALARSAGLVAQVGARLVLTPRGRARALTVRAAGINAAGNGPALRGLYRPAIRS